MPWTPECRSFVKDPVQSTQQCDISIEVAPPMGWMLVPNEYNIDVTFLVVPRVNQVNKQPNILLIELAGSNCANNNARKALGLEDRRLFSRLSSSGKTADCPLNEVGFNAPLVTLTAESQAK